MGAFVEVAVKGEEEEEILGGGETMEQLQKPLQVNVFLSYEICISFFPLNCTLLPSPLSIRRGRFEDIYWSP